MLNKLLIGLVTIACYIALIIMTLTALATACTYPIFGIPTVLLASYLGLKHTVETLE